MEYKILYRNGVVTQMHILSLKNKVLAISALTTCKTLVQSAGTHTLIDVSENLFGCEVPILKEKGNNITGVTIIYEILKKQNPPVVYIVNLEIEESIPSLGKVKIVDS